MVDKNRPDEGEQRNVPLKDIKIRTKLQHESLTEIQSALSRYSYKWAGKYIQPTYEQWEANFLRDMHPDTELRYWLYVAATIRTLQHHNADKIKRVIGDLIAGTPDETTKQAWEAVQQNDAKFVREAFKDAGFAVGEHE